jgi:hypothetical protein
MPIEAVNDFVIRFANVNGSGSASANLLFARSILRMGVPIAPRNIFPSNIQGLPTWYEVRVSEQGHLGALAALLDLDVSVLHAFTDDGAKGEDDVRQLAGILDGWPARRPFLCGPDLTVADFSVGAWLNYADRAGYPIDDFRQVRRWYAGLLEMPAWRQSIVAPPF